MSEPVERPATPYEAIGGKPVIEAIVSRFYDLMEHDPAYARLRALHDEDLSTVREGLTEFLVAWTGGPSEWFSRGKCVMSLHRDLPIPAEVGEQWADAMSRAIAGQREMDDGLARAMTERLGLMARGMVNQQAGNRAA